MSLVSIIVPIYNVETYIGKCLKSLVNQTYEDIEIVTKEKIEEMSKYINN